MSADAGADRLACPDRLSDRLSDHRHLHVGAVLRGLDVRRGLGPVLQLQRVVRGERRPLPPRQLRPQPLRVLRDDIRPADPAPDRVAGADARDPGAVRPLLPRPHERADVRALAAPDDGGAERGPDAFADSVSDAGSNGAAVAVALVRAGAASDAEPVHRTEPGALSRSVTRARVRTHGEPDAVAQLHAELGAVAVPVRGTVAESESGPNDCADATAKHAGALSGYVSAHVDDAAHGRADSETEPVSDARSDNGSAHAQSDRHTRGGRTLHHTRWHRVR